MGILRVLVTARMSSSRLPRKHLLPMYREASSIRCLIERFIAAGAKPTLCCADVPADQPLRDVATEIGIDAYAGDPDNVLRRYRAAMEKFGEPAAIIVDADDIFVSTAAISRMNAIYDDHDSIMCRGLPYGGAPFLLSRALLDRLLAANITPNGWSRFVAQMDGKNETLLIDGFSEEEQNLRLSLDYPEDLAFLRHLYANVPRTGIIEPEDIVSYVRLNRSSLAEEFPKIFDGSVSRWAMTHLAVENHE